MLCCDDRSDHHTPCALYNFVVVVLALFAFLLALSYARVTYVCFRRSYNTLMAIVSGVNCAAVQRLRKSFEGLSSSHTSTWEKLEAVLSPENNYGCYRAIQDERQPVFIPFLGLYLKDMTFMNENPKKLANGLIDFSKLRMIADLVWTLQNFQHTQYSFESDPEARLSCLQTFALPEDRLYKYSLKCEPREAGASRRLIEKWAME